ncbi:hypothetical protein ABZ776_23400 [Streptomyces sp. NPDC007076]|uniref:hypothetical protein n=1 Tax=unclassified Streptomyces TaxID=2593676 RepID=UPI002E765665|nr:hypothetical protein [Streptomyces sp. JV190]MEE1841397.1 hypothetical protein [Streptomyces sp. JV190]
MEPQPSETSREAKALWQGFLFRPWTGQSPYSMPSVGLYLVGAATSPGAGLNGTYGWNVAEDILKRRTRTHRFGARIARTMRQ